MTIRHHLKGRDVDYEAQANLLFREDARRLGYLEPGGKGLWAYYTDRGMVPPDRNPARPLGDAGNDVRELTNTALLISWTVDEPGQFPRAPRNIPAAGNSWED